MSRTTRKRKHSRWGANTIEEVTQQAVKYYLFRSHTYVRHRKKKAVYDAEFKKAGEEFQAEWQHLMQSQTLEGLETRDYWRKYNDAPHSLRYKYYVSRYYVVRVEKVLEDEIAEAVEEFGKRTRDGYGYDERRKAYRTSSADSIRRKNKQLCRDIMRGEEYDTKPYPSHYEEKQRIWDHW